MTLAEAVAALVKRLVGAPRPPETKEVARRLVANWTTEHASGPTNWHVPRPEFLSRLNALIDEPWRLSQGSTLWCTHASFLHVALTRFPATVAQYGLDLYETGEAKLGDIDVEVPAELREFDWAAYETGRGNAYRAIDWMLLAGVVDGTNLVFDYTGPMNSLGAGPPLSASTASGYFDDADLYADVTTTSIRRGMTSDEVVALTESGNDFVLIGKLSYLSLGNSTDPFLGHAVALVDRLRLDSSGQIVVKFVTAGDYSQSLEPSRVNGILTITDSVDSFTSRTSDMIVATL